MARFDLPRGSENSTLSLMNTPAIKGTSGKAEFQKLLRKWLKGVEDYGKWWKWTDCCWWHRERPALSIFSGAVWKTGGIAIEEWRAVKFAKTKGGCKYGRCDLSFGLIGTSGRHKSYDAEAKHVWCKLDKPPSGQIERAFLYLQWACDEAERLKNCPNKLGILFVSFAITRTGKRILPARRRKVAGELKERITEFIRAFQKPGNCTATAWFVLTGREHVDCPGGAVLIRESV